MKAYADPEESGYDFLFVIVAEVAPMFENVVDVGGKFAWFHASLTPKFILAPPLVVEALPP